MRPVADQTRDPWICSQDILPTVLWCAGFMADVM